MILDGSGPTHLVVDVSDRAAACGSIELPRTLLAHYAMHYRQRGAEACRECVDVVTGNLLLATELPDGV